MNLNVFNEIEEKYNLNELNINGYYYWNYLRKEVFVSCAKKKNNLGNAHSNRKINLVQKIRNVKGKIVNILFGKKMKEEDCSILVLNHPRRVLVDDLYECIYTDEIVDNLTQTVVLEEAYQDKHYKPARTKNIFYTDILDIYIYIYSSFYRFFKSKRFKNIKEIMVESIREPIADLNRLYEINIESKQFENSLIYGYCSYIAEKRYFNRIITKLNPKIILEVVSYGRKSMVINEIAFEKGIPTVELQHGTIGKAHISYNYPSGKKIKQFPEYIFLFSDYWKSKAKFPIKEEKRIAVGYPFLDRMSGKKWELHTGDNKIKILFLSSGPIGSMLANVAVELSERLNMDEYSIIYKLHPGEYAIWKEKYKNLITKKITVIDNNRTNLYELFATSNIQVSGYDSTTVFEGLYFELPTFILDYCVSEEINELCEIGIANYFNTAAELYESIKNINKKKMTNKICLWKQNGLKNVIEEIDKILNSKNNS